MPEVMRHRPVEGPCWFTDTWLAPRPGGRQHEGLDIGADAGKPIYAVVDGTISKKYLDQPGWKGGNALRLTAADGTYYFYGHLSAFAEGIEAGVPVTAGTVIGFVGMTGNAGVNHLHFEIHPGGGKPVNPYPIAREAKACEQMGKAQPTPPSPTTTAPGGGPTTTAAGGGGSPSSVALVSTDGGEGPACVAKYQVRANDYWFFIAASTGVRASNLAAANNRTIESFIYPDEQLCVPDPSWRPAAAPTPSTPATTAKPGTATTKPSSRQAAPVSQRTYKCASKYTVIAGDYWYMLAKWFQVRASTLAAANKRTIDDPIHPGEKLCIPA